MVHLSENYKRALQRCRNHLVKEIDIVYIVDDLNHFENACLRSDQREKILSHQIKEDRVKSFLDIIDRNDFFESFMGSLCKHYFQSYSVLKETLNNIYDKDQNRIFIPRHVLQNYLPKKCDNIMDLKKTSDAAKSYLDEDPYIDCYSIPIRKHKNEKWVKSECNFETVSDVLCDNDPTYVANLVKDVVFRRLSLDEIPDGVKKPPSSCVCYCVDIDETINRDEHMKNIDKVDLDDECNLDRAVQKENPPPVPPKPKVRTSVSFRKSKSIDQSDPTDSLNNCVDVNVEQNCSQNCSVSSSEIIDYDISPTPALPPRKKSYATHPNYFSSNDAVMLNETNEDNNEVTNNAQSTPILDVISKEKLNLDQTFDDNHDPINDQSTPFLDFRFKTKQNIDSVNFADESLNDVETLSNICILDCDESKTVGIDISTADDIVDTTSKLGIEQLSQNYFVDQETYEVITPIDKGASFLEKTNLDINISHANSLDAIIADNVNGFDEYPEDDLEIEIPCDDDPNELIFGVENDDSHHFDVLLKYNDSINNEGKKIIANHSENISNESNASRVIESPEEDSIKSNRSIATDSGIDFSIPSSSLERTRFIRQSHSFPVRNRSIRRSRILPGYISKYRSSGYNGESSDDNSFYEDIDHYEEKSPCKNQSSYLDPQLAHSVNPPLIELKPQFTNNDNFIPVDPFSPLSEKVILSTNVLLIADKKSVSENLDILDADEDLLKWRNLFLVFDKFGRAFYISKDLIKRYGDPDGEIWFYPIEISSRQASLFLSETHQDGCFIIYIPTNKLPRIVYNLSICRADGEVVHYHIIKNDHGDLKIQGHDMSFMNITDLVNYFKCNKNKLATRLRRTLKEAYYAITPGYHYNHQWEINRIGLKLSSKIIGKGSYGVVCSGSYYKQPIACKVLQRSDVSVKDQDDFIHEACILMRLKHEHIIKLIGLSCKSHPYFLLTELASRGNLYDCLRNDSLPFDKLDTLFDICIQVSSAVFYLESKRWILHRDIAARNCFVTDDLCIKLGNFGRAIQVSDGMYQASSSEHIPTKWSAPEVLMSSTYSNKSDVWSFGVLLWEIFSRGEQPFIDLNSEQTVAYVISGGRLEKPADCSTDMFTHMQCCWRSNADDRPSFSLLYEALQGESSIYYGPVRPRYSQDSHHSMYRISHGSDSSGPVLMNHSPPEVPARIKINQTKSSTLPPHTFAKTFIFDDINEEQSNPVDSNVRTSSSETSLISSNLSCKDDMSRGDKIRKSLRKIMHAKPKKKNTKSSPIGRSQSAAAADTGTKHASEEGADNLKPENFSRHNNSYC